MKLCMAQTDSLCSLFKTTRRVFSGVSLKHHTQIREHKRNLLSAWTLNQEQRQSHQMVQGVDMRATVRLFDELH